MEGYNKDDSYMWDFPYNLNLFKGRLFEKLPLKAESRHFKVERS